MKFKQYLSLSEMAFMKGGYDNDTFSHENEWYEDYIPVNNNNTKLLSQNSKGYKLYQTEYIMFMTNKTDEYLGAVEYNVEGKTIIIETAHSKMKGGFYKNLFELLFKKFKEIKSDHVLSKEAFKAYTNLTSQYTLTVKDQEGKSYEFNKKNLFVDTNGKEFHSDKHDIHTYFRIISVTK